MGGQIILAILLLCLLVQTFYTIGFIDWVWFAENVMVADEKSMLFKMLAKRNPRLDKLFEEVVGLCRQRGFNLPELKIFLVNRLVSTTFCGNYDHASKRIFIYMRNTSYYSDDDLRVLIAHEAGHNIYRMGMNSHPFLKRISRITTNSENVADMVSIYLYGEDMFIKTLHRVRFRTTVLEKIKNIEFTRHHLDVRGRTPRA